MTAFRHPLSRWLPPGIRRPVGGRSVAALAAVVALSGCSGQAAPPVDPAETPSSGDMTDVSHTLEPTEQMRLSAEQQCLDDPDLSTGYVKAVAPESGQALAELTIDCDTVRTSG